MGKNIILLVFLSFLIALFILSIILTIKIFHNEKNKIGFFKFNPQKYFSVSINSNFVKKHTTCPKCGMTFKANKKNLNIKESDNNDDSIGYINCPSCNYEIPIFKFSLNFFDYNFDSFNDSYRQKHPKYYTHCPKCGKLISFNESDVLRKSNGDCYLKCDTVRCQTLFKLNKANIFTLKH